MYQRDFKRQEIEHYHIFIGELRSRVAALGYSRMHILRYHAYYPLHFLPDHLGGFCRRSGLSNRTSSRCPRPRSRNRRLRDHERSGFDTGQTGKFNFLISHFTSYHLSFHFSLATIRTIAESIEAVEDHTIPASGTQPTKPVFDNFQFASQNKIFQPKLVTGFLA